jgi:hypothetical protein
MLIILTMKLIDWVEKEKGNGSAAMVYRKLSDKTNLNDRYLYYIAMGKNKPHLESAIKISEATGREVSLTDLLPVLEGRK